MSVATKIDITRYRGDVYPDVITVIGADGDIEDVSGSTFTLSLSDTNDSETASYVYQITGTFVTDGTDGKVQFLPTATQANQTPKVYYYDIQMVTGAENRTIAVGSYIYVQDINKD